MILKAIEDDHYVWLNYVWAFKKNYFQVKGGRPKRVSLQTLFLYIINVCKKITTSEKPYVDSEKIKIVCEWMLDFKDEESASSIGSKQDEEEEEKDKSSSDINDEDKEDKENILQALLFHMMDPLAIEYMGYYSMFLNHELFLFSLQTNNKYFIQQSLLTGAFEKQQLRSEEVVGFMLECMQDGSKTNFLLQTMLLTEVSLWKNQQISQLIEIFQEFIDAKYNENRLLLSYNPLMSITLSAELLSNIGQTRKRFENECIALIDGLLQLGKVYNDKIEDEKQFENLIMDTDFQNRTVLKIITSCKFEALMSEEDPKTENIMNNIFIGEDATRCDGNMFGYSTLMHILSQKPKIAKANDNDFFKMITIDFEYKIKVDYTFQHRYRSRSIQFYFQKELCFGLLIAGINTYIYGFDYYTKFKENDAYYYSQKFDNGTLIDKINGTYLTGPYDFAAVKPRR